MTEYSPPNSHYKGVLGTGKNESYRQEGKERQKGKEERQEGMQISVIVAVPEWNHLRVP